MSRGGRTGFSNRDRLPHLVLFLARGNGSHFQGSFRMVVPSDLMLRFEGVVQSWCVDSHSST